MNVYIVPKRREKKEKKRKKKGMNVYIYTWIMLKAVVADDNNGSVVQSAMSMSFVLQINVTSFN